MVPFKSTAFEKGFEQMREKSYATEFGVLCDFYDLDFFEPARR